MNTDLLLLINLFDLYIEDIDKFTIYYNVHIASNYYSFYEIMLKYLQLLGSKHYDSCVLSIYPTLGIYRIRFITNFNLL